MVSTLVAIRHGKPDTEGYANSDLYPLSEEGKEIQKRMAAILEEKGFRPDHILTSPLLRAQQTAEVLAEHFSVPVNDEPALGGLFDPQKLLKQIPPPKSGQTLFFVGHAPTLAELINKLVGQTVLPDGLSKSSAAIITFEDKIAPGAASFVAYYSPQKT